MDTPQAAASLFGDDSSSDPFAVIGAESAQNAAPTASTESDDFFALVGQEVQSDYTPSAGEAAYAAYSQPSTKWDAPVKGATHNAQQSWSYEPAQSTQEGAYVNGYAGTC